MFHRLAALSCLPRVPYLPNAALCFLVMRWRHILGLAALCAAAGELPEQVRELSRIRLKMREHLATLPNYTCLAVVERTQRAPNQRTDRHEDTVRIEVAHVDDRDMMAWPGAVEFRTADPSQLIGYGMFSSGEFFAHLASIFSQAAVIAYNGPETIGGRKLLRWDYQAAGSLGSEWVITSAGRSAVTGERGSFWSDPTNHEVLRLDIASDGLPPNFPIRDVRSEIDYARVRIGERDVYLPQTARVTLTETMGERRVNTIEFSHCRQYLTHSEIRYADDDRATEASPTTGVREIVLPENLRVTAELAGAIDPSIQVGDPIQAVVTADAVQKKRIVIPKGAVLTGRVRQVELDSSTTLQRYLLGLEFTDLTYPGYHARFFAHLVRAAGYQTKPAGAPGVAVLVLASQPFELKNGTVLQWLTEDISRK